MKTVILNGNKFTGINPILKPAISGIWQEYNLYVIALLAVVALAGKFLPLTVIGLALISLYLFGGYAIDFL